MFDDIIRHNLQGVDSDKVSRNFLINYNLNKDNCVSTTKTEILNQFLKTKKTLSTKYVNELQSYYITTQGITRRT